MSIGCYKNAELRQLEQDPRKQLINQRHTMPYEKKLAYANDWIYQSLAQSKNPCIAISGGIDSTVLMHMVRKFRNVKAIWINTGIELPETVKYMQKIQNLDIITPDRTYWDICKEFGYPGQSRVNKQPACCRWLKEYPMRDYCKQNHVDLVYTGLTASEGQHRRYNYILRGAYYHHKNWDLMKCTPIILFMKEDVWKYATDHDLPVNEAYKKYNIERTGCMACTGFYGWEKKMKVCAPSMLKKIQAEIKKTVSVKN